MIVVDIFKGVRGQSVLFFLTVDLNFVHGITWIRCDRKCLIGAGCNCHRSQGRDASVGTGGSRNCIIACGGETGRYGMIGLDIVEGIGCLRSLGGTVHHDIQYRIAGIRYDGKGFTPAVLHADGAGG